MIKSSPIFNLLAICQLLLLHVTGTVALSGGQPEDIRNAPFLAQVYVGGEFKCVATLVSDRAAVTAASCVHNVVAEELTVIAGVVNFLDAAAISTPVSDIILHQNFKIDTYNNDVAVLQLKNPINSGLAKPISLCKNSWRGVDELKLYGWSTDNINATHSPTLASASFKVMKQKQCRESYDSTMSITNSMFCVTAEGNSTCFGDAGSPVIINDQLCGIATGLFGCQHPNVPHVFTNIFGVRKFITKVMRSISKRVPN